MYRIPDIPVTPEELAYQEQLLKKYQGRLAQAEEAGEGLHAWAYRDLIKRIERTIKEMKQTLGVEDEE